MLLENVTSPYRRPCILDLKIGTRVRENASPAKLARHVTAIDVGARLSGMQVLLQSAPGAHCMFEPCCALKALFFFVLFQNV